MCGYPANGFPQEILYTAKSGQEEYTYMNRTVRQSIYVFMQFWSCLSWSMSFFAGT